jgi:hypothetical protein
MERRWTAKAVVEKKFRPHPLYADGAEDRAPRKASGLDLCDPSAQGGWGAAIKMRTDLAVHLPFHPRKVDGDAKIAVLEFQGVQFRLSSARSELSDFR